MDASAGVGVDEVCPEIPFCTLLFGALLFVGYAR